MATAGDPMEVDLMNIDETKQFDEIHVDDVSHISRKNSLLL